MPVKLIIRDDDTNFFTKPEDLALVYKIIQDVPVSFAIVPQVLEAGACPDCRGNNEPRFVGENTNLVSYLKEHLKNGKCDILMHGITHQYKFSSSQKKISEMIWRSKDLNLNETIKTNKEHLEDLFNTDIKCFVAPHNDISKESLKAVYLNGMDYSGIVAINYNREKTIRSFSNYIRRMWVRTYKRIPIPLLLDYGSHKELNACAVSSFERMKTIYDFAKTHNSPMAINVHYWDMRDRPEKYKVFFDFIKFALDDGAIPSRMRDCM